MIKHMVSVKISLFLQYNHHDNYNHNNHHNNNNYNYYHNNNVSYLKKAMLQRKSSWKFILYQMIEHFVSVKISLFLQYNHHDNYHHYYNDHDYNYYHNNNNVSYLKKPILL